MITDDTIEWLLAGDPVIRWQVKRDLLGDPTWEDERERTLEHGWVRRFLDQRTPDGLWPEGRWTGMPWVLLTLMDCGIPKHSAEGAEAAGVFLDRRLPSGEVAKQIARMDLCHLGFWIRIGGYFTPTDERMSQIADCLFDMQMADGGWNCSIRKKPTRHSSFHTTFNVLEGLREFEPSTTRFKEAEARAMEFMLQHQMYRSDKTGEVIRECFLHLTHPSYWHYTVLRGLDYMRSTPQIADERLSDPIAQLRCRAMSDGRWIVEKRIPGIVHFDMEEQGKPSRWNTLRALRVLQARSKSAEIAVSEKTYPQPGTSKKPVASE